MAPRPEKVAVVDRVSEQLTDAAATLLTDYRGLTVTELAQLRGELRKVDATYEVVKNTLTRLAARQAGMDGLDEMLVGPTALVFCGEDPVGPAKALRAFAKDHEELVVKGGYLDGAVLEAADAERLADLASREDLLATLAGMMNNALAGFARLLQAPLADMARLQQALVDDGGVEAKGFAPTGAAAAPAADDTSAEDATADASAGEPEDGPDTVEQSDAVVATAATEELVESAPEALDTADGQTAADDASDAPQEDAAPEDAAPEDAAPEAAAADEQTVADGALEDVEASAPDASDTPAAEADPEDGVPEEAELDEQAPAADAADEADADPDA